MKEQREPECECDESKLSCFKGKRADVGGCNSGCDSFVVWVINAASLQMRLCDKCMKKLRAATR